MAAPDAPRARRWGVALGLLLGALLMMAGVGQTRSLIDYLLDVDRAADFAQASAIVRDVDLKTTDTGDGTSYRLTVNYVYRHQGLERLGHQVELVDHPALVPKWAPRVAERLQAAQAAAAPIPCFVDLADPQKVVLDRQLRYTVLTARLAAAVFLLAAGVLVWIGLAWWWRSAQQLEARQQSYPGEPWRWNAAWDEGRLPSSNRTALVTLAVLAVLWNGAVTPLALGIHRELGGAGRFGTIGGIIAVLGLLVAWAAVNQFWRWLKYGVSEFQLAHVPGVIGGPLGGVVQVRARLATPAGFEARLSCLERPRGEDTSTRVVWQDQAVIRETLASHDPERLGVPIYFAIPYDCPPTSLGRDKTTITWKLDLRRGSGLPFAQFTVPVFRTADSSRDDHPDQELLARHSPTVLGPDALRAAGIEVTPTPGGWRINGALRRDVATLAGLAAVCVACWAAVVFVLLARWHWAFSIVPAIVGLLCTYALVELALWGARLEIDGSRARASWGYGPVRRSRAWNHFDPQSDVAVDHEYSANEQQYYCVVVRKGGETVPLAKRIASRRLADAAANALRGILSERRATAAPAADAQGSEPALQSD